MLTIGFELKLDSHPVSTTTTSSTPSVEPSSAPSRAVKESVSTETARSSPDESEAEDLLRLMTAAGHQCTELLLVMTEPDVTAPDVWVRWFDDLSAMAEYLKQEAQAMDS